MNLLTDAWLPVDDGHTRRRVSLRDVLCSDSAFTVSTPRDDFDAAVVTLSAALVQSLFPDLEDEELVERERTPLTREDFSRRASAQCDYFDLFHARHPFMQTRSVAAEIKNAGMIVPGAPGASSHLLGFRATSSPRRFCDSCVTLALYVRATMSPSFGGGYCGTIRGGAPIDFHVRGPHLREAIWRNVISGPTRRSLIVDDARVNDLPTWVSPIPNGVPVKAETIGLVRGLLWQPAVIELHPDTHTGTCDLCGVEDVYTVSRYRALKFKVIVDGLFPHPRGAQRYYKSQETGTYELSFTSYTDSSPVWGLMSRWSASADAEARLAQEPPVVTQFRRIWPDRPIEVAAVGYVTKQAKIEQRRAETVVLAQGKLAFEAANAASSVRDAVFGAVVAIGRDVKLKSPSRLASRAALQLSQWVDGDVRQAISTGLAVDERFATRLRGAAMRCFEDAVDIVGRDARTSQAVSLGRVRLRTALASLLGSSLPKEINS